MIRFCSRAFRALSELEGLLDVVDVISYEHRMNARRDLGSSVNDILDALDGCRAIVHAPGIENDPLSQFELRISRYLELWQLKPVQ